MNRWLGKEKDNNDNVTYWTHWGRQDGIQVKFIEGMETQVANLAPNKWRIVHAHGHSLFPNTSEPYLYQWREAVEAQNCGFVVTTRNDIVELTEKQKFRGPDDTGYATIGNLSFGHVLLDQEFLLLNSNNQRFFFY